MSDQKYLDQIAKQLDAKRRKDATLKGKAYNFLDALDQGLTYVKEGPKRGRIKEDQQVVARNPAFPGRHDLYSPTGGDSRPRQIAPADRVPEHQQRLQQGRVQRRPMNLSKMPRGGARRIGETFIDRIRDAAQPWLYETSLSSGTPRMMTPKGQDQDTEGDTKKKTAKKQPVTAGRAVAEAVDRIIESALANAAGSKLGAGGGMGSAPVINNSVVSKVAGGANVGSGRLGGGFGTQGKGAGRFSGGGQKFGSRATAAAGVQDVGHGGSFGAPVGSKMSPGGPASRGQTTSAFTGGGSRAGSASAAGGGQKTSLGGVGRTFTGGAGAKTGPGTTGNVTGTTPSPTPPAGGKSSTGQTQSASPSSGTSVPPVGGGDKTQHNKRDLNPGNISQAQRQAGSDIMHNQAARTGAPNMQRERAFAAGTGGRFAGGGPRPVSFGGGGSYGGGSSWGHSQSGYRNTTNFNIGGSVGFGGGSSRGRIGGSFGSSSMRYGSRSSGYYR